MAESHVHDTLVVGAGFTGIGTAIKLTRADVDDFVIVEREDRVGGTWRDNTYPGAACDIPSLLYSFSFAKNPEWSRAYSPAGEICRHIENLVDDFDLGRRIQFGVEVNGLQFDETQGTWTVRTTGRKCFTARTVVLASGPLPDHKLPDIRGVDTYAGKVIHSARWDHDYDFTGKRVAVIGTGASAVQIVPELVKQAEFVKVFQRTPGWVLPRLDIPIPAAAQGLFAKVPATQQLARQALYWGHEVSATALVWDSPLTGLVARLGRAHLRRQVKDPWLRRQLTPDFTPGCKRMLVSSDYYPALQRDNCKLIDWPIATMSPVGIRTSDGVEHHLDCIVFATGLRRAPDRTAVPGHRARWPLAGRRMGQRRAGLQEHQRARLSEPVLHDRPELRAGAQLTAGLRRGADRLRGARDHHDPRRRPALSRCPRRRAAALQPADPAAADQDHLDVGLQQLVSDEGRLQRVDVPGLRHPVSSSDAGLPIRRLRRARKERENRSRGARRGRARGHVLGLR